MAGATHKKRIARIGNLSNMDRETESQSNDGRIQVDCVYEIMESMNKTENNVMSYHQLQDLKTKKNLTSLAKNSLKSTVSSKPNNLLHSSNQIKKFLPEKTFPLMAKCKKSMTYLKKNLCIPKPRAHVSSLPNPFQNRISNLKQNMSKNPKAVGLKKHSLNKQFAKRRKNSENDFVKQQRETKLADRRCNSNALHSEDFIKECINNSGTESEDEFEKFLQAHQPKDVCTSDSDSSVDIRKSYENKKRIKRSRQLISHTKITKVTSRKLSDSERSLESHDEDESQINNSDSHVNETKTILSDFNGEQFPTKKRRRIINNSSDDNVSDTCDDIGTVDCDLFSSGEEGVSNCSTNAKCSNSVSEQMNLDDEFEKLSEVLTEPSCGASTLAIPSDKNKLLKLKCMNPCYVVIKRDPELNRKAESLRDNALFSNSDDDCIIVEENLTNFTNQTSRNMSYAKTGEFANGIPPLESERMGTNLRNDICGNLTQVSKSPSDSVTLAEMSDVQNKPLHQKEMVHGSNGLGQQTETNLHDKQLINSKSLRSFTNTSLEKQVCKVEESCHNSSRNSVATSANGLSKEDRVFVHDARNCHKDSAENVFKQMSSIKESVLLGCDKPEPDAKECFNVQIVSVKSLNESDVIVLSDDSEGKDGEIVSTLNGAKTSSECTMEEFDDIICLNTSSGIEQTSNNAVENVTNNETLKGIEKSAKVQIGIPKNSSDQRVLLNQEDCVILDDSSFPNEKNIAAKQQNQVKPDHLLTDGENSNKSDIKISASTSDSSKNSILQIVDSIDFNFIKKFINEINAPENGKVNNSDNVGDENSIPLRADIPTSVKSTDLLPERKQKKNQNKRSRFEKETLADLNVTFNESYEGNVEVNILETNSNEDNKDSIKLLRNSNEAHQHILQTECNLDSDIQIIGNIEGISSSTNASVKCSDVNASHENYKNLLDSEVLLISDDIPLLTSKKLSKSAKNLGSKQAVLNSKGIESAITSSSENVPSQGKSSLSTSKNCDNNLKYHSSIVKQSVPTLSVCKEEAVTSHPTELRSNLKNLRMFPEKFEIENKESISDELDIIAAKSIQNLDEFEQKTILPLLQLYRIEYQKFMEVKCIEQNVSDGLKLLEEKQAKKLMHISASIKNIVKHDACFHKLNKIESHQISLTSCPAKKEHLDEPKDRSRYLAQPSSSNCAEAEKVNVDDKVRIFDPSVVEILKSNSVGPSSSQEVYNRLINSVCAECGKHAVAACSGCAKVYYCSEKCGRTHWDKGHYATCR